MKLFYMLYNCLTTTRIYTSIYFQLMLLFCFSHTAFHALWLSHSHLLWYPAYFFFNYILYISTLSAFTKYIFYSLAIYITGVSLSVFRSNAYIYIYIYISFSLALTYFCTHTNIPYTSHIVSLFHLFSCIFLCFSYALRTR